MWQLGSEASAQYLTAFVVEKTLALVLVEFADLVFAVDSVPAVLTITTEPFIYTPNIFAILGAGIVVSLWKTRQVGTKLESR